MARNDFEARLLTRQEFHWIIRDIQGCICSTAMSMTARFNAFCMYTDYELPTLNVYWLNCRSHHKSYKKVSEIL